MTGYTIRERELLAFNGTLQGYNVEIVNGDGRVRTTVEARFDHENTFFGGIEKGGVTWAALGIVDADLAAAFAAAIVRGTELIAAHEAAEAGGER